MTNFEKLKELILEKTTGAYKAAEMTENGARVRLLPCEETWYGVTYREDLPTVRAAVARMKAEGIYPPCLWEA